MPPAPSLAGTAVMSVLSLSPSQCFLQGEPFSEEGYSYLRSPFGPGLNKL